jgi:hypothetical protein
MDSEGDRGSRPRPSNLYVAIVVAEVAFLVWLGWRRSQLVAFGFLALMGALALYGANIAAISSARMARWMRTRGMDDS